MSFTCVRALYLRREPDCKSPTKTASAGQLAVAAVLIPTATEARVTRADPNA